MKLHTQAVLLGLVFISVSTAFSGCSKKSTTAANAKNATNAGSPSNGASGSPALKASVLRLESASAESGDKVEPTVATVFIKSSPLTEQPEVLKRGFPPMDEDDGPKSVAVKPRIPDAEAWNVPLDQPRIIYDIVADTKLDLPLRDHTIMGSKWPALPVISDLGGPYIIVPPNWKSLEYKPAEDGKTDMVYSVTPQEPVREMDLRTGKSCGQFRWDAPAWSEPSLSPNGLYLVGPFRVPLLYRGKGGRQEEEALAALYIWKRDSEAEPQAMPMDGHVVWYGFIGRDELGVLISDVDNYEKQRLQIWNVTTGKKRATVQMPYKGSRPNTTAPAEIQRRQSFGDLAISPRGKYMAITGTDALALISLVDGKVVGQINSPDFGSTDGVGFSDDAASLFVITSSPNHGARLVLTFDAKNGRLVSTQELKGSPSGDIVWGSREGVLVSSPRVAALARSGEKTFTGLTGIDRVMRMWDTGPVVVIRGERESPATFEVVSRNDFMAMADKLSPSPPSKAATMLRLTEDAAKVIATETIESSKFNPSEAPAVAKLEEMNVEPQYVAVNQQTKAALFVSTNQVFVMGVGNSNVFEINFAKLGADDKPEGTPAPARRWSRNSQSKKPPVRLFDITRQADRFLLSDPDEPSHVEVWAGDGSYRLVLQPADNKTSVEWAMFTADDKLAVLAGGDLKIIDVGTSEAKVIYRSREANYGQNASLTADRRHAVLVRGRMLDLVDLGTGTVIQRVAPSAAALRLPWQVDLSPDGRRAAVVYGPYRSRHYDMASEKQWETNNSSHKLAIVDFVTGEELECDLSAYPSQVKWASPEHLCLVEHQKSVIFDVKLNMRTMATVGNASGGSDVITTTSNGQVWRKEKDPSTQKVKWGQLLTADRAAMFAADRELLPLDSLPIALEIDTEEREASETAGQALIKQLQQRGMTIGGGGLTLRVNHAVEGNEHMPEEYYPPGGERQVLMIPRVHSVHWDLVDAQGQVVWSAKKLQSYRKNKSKYYKEKTDNGPGFDFGDEDPKKALAIDVIFQCIQTLPEDFPQLFMKGNGQFNVMPWALKL